MTVNPFVKKYLMTAGPTPLPPEVSQVMAEPILYHRAPAGVELYARVLENLKSIFATENDVLLFSASGSGAMESAVANLVGPNDPILVCSAGKFGERWLELGDAYGAQMVRYEPEWGQRFDPVEIDGLLAKNSDVRVCFATLSETSTGIVHDIEAIAAVTQKHDVILVVDAVSGLGAAELYQDAWGVDVVCSGSQKALMCPPGIALASVSQRALDYAADRGSPSYYFNWKKTAAAQRKNPPNSPFTPPVTLLAALDVALKRIAEEGLPEVYARHALLAKAARAGVGALGLSLFGDPDDRANVVTAVALPEQVDGGRLVKDLRDSYGVTANGGQAQLKGKILRIAHTGYFGAFDILISLSALEMALSEQGYPVIQGHASGAAQQVFLDAR